jgi:polar amino acid transport system permease protein
VSDFAQFLTSPFLATGALVTLEVAAGAFAVALVVGTLLATIQLRHIPVLSAATRAYAIITRGTPLLLQLLFVYDVLPAFGLRFSELTTAIAVMGLSTATFFSEILRGAVTSLDRDQIVAAESLGMRPSVVARRIIAPQAMRIALPNLANQVVVLILSSSLASTISVAELTLRSQELSAATFKVLAVYSASSLMYLVLTSAVALIQLWLERALALEAAPIREPWLKQWSRRFGQLTGAGVLGSLTPARTKAEPMPAFARATSTTRSESEQDSDDDIELVDTRLHLQAIAKHLGGSSDAGPLRSPTLDVQNIVKSYGTRSVLRGVSLQVDRGEVVVIMGPSGCGKSTLLRCIARLEPFDAGQILIEGTPFGVNSRGTPLRGRARAEARARAPIGLGFQHF